MITCHAQTVDAAPVVVTRELIAALADLPVRQAAAAAGVSATVFKKACLKGVYRFLCCL